MSADRIDVPPVAWHRTRREPRRAARGGVRAVALALVAAISVALARPLAAQTRELVGIVRDAGGGVMGGVTVTAAGTSTISDDRGAFRLVTPVLDTVTVSFRQLGYEPIDARIRARGGVWDTVLVQLSRVPQQLAKLDVNESRTRSALGLRDFETRRRRGIGVFLTRADIADRNTSSMEALMRGRKGVQLVRGRVRFVAAGARVCQPNIWLDGVQARGLELTDILPSDVEALEMYANFSTVPFEFTPMSTATLNCGTIAVWTRIPNGKAR